MRTTVLFLLAALIGCGKNGDPSPNVPDRYKTDAVPVKKGVVRTWKTCTSDLGCKADFPDTTPDAQTFSQNDANRQYVAQLRFYRTEQYNVKKLEKNEGFIPDLACRLLVVDLRPKLKKEREDATITALREEFLLVKGRTASAPATVTWAGSPATEVVYEAEGATKPRITVRELRVGDRLYFGSTLEGIEPVPTDVAKFFDSFTLPPASK